jgi:transposase
MQVEIIPNRNSHPTILLREAHREGKRIVKTKVANLTKVMTVDQALLLRGLLKGEQLVSVGKDGETLEKHIKQRSTAYGHVKIVLTAMTRLGVAELLDPLPSRKRSLAMCLIAARMLEPGSKLSTAGWLDNSALSSELGIAGADEDDLYEAMDWLLERQGSIEKSLAKRHAVNGAPVFLDMSSSYYTGQKALRLAQEAEKAATDEDREARADDAAEDKAANDKADGYYSLVRRGYSRDRKRGFPQVNYGLLTDGDGRPISIHVFPGNVSDSTIVMPILGMIRADYGLSKIVLVGDRGMITGKTIKILRCVDGIDWISALRSSSIKNLVDIGKTGRTLFDERDLCEFIDESSYPGERLIACKNWLLAERRNRERIALISKTEKVLDAIKDRVKAGKLKTADKIGKAVGKVINKYKMNKHIILDISDGTFDYSLNEESIAKERDVDGIYVIRTSLPADVITAAESVRQYKNLANVERGFRTMKTVSLKIRPIYHSHDNRIRSHIFLTMIAYYVEWHMRNALKPLTFADDSPPEHENPVVQKKRSLKADHKAATKMNEDLLLPVGSFSSLMKHMAEMCKITNEINLPGVSPIIFVKEEIPTERQRKALELLETITCSQ